MIRLRDISLPPEHSASQLQYEAARLLRLSPSKIREKMISELGAAVELMKSANGEQ